MDFRGKTDFFRAGISSMLNDSKPSRLETAPCALSFFLPKSRKKP
jgi:hypothetical protein